MEMAGRGRRTSGRDFLMIGGVAWWGRLVRLKTLITRVCEGHVKLTSVVMGKLYVYSRDLGLSEIGETSSFAHHAGQSALS